MNRAKILLVDDDESFLELFGVLIRGWDLEVATALSAKEALGLLEKESITLVITDIQMPEMSGIDLFRAIQDSYPEIPVILITAFGSTEQAIQAVKQGAFHYFEKPVHDKLDLIWTAVREALTKREMLRELAAFHKEKTLNGKNHITLVGESPGLKKVLGSIDEAAPCPVAVLISGETGTGKELVARTIHKRSARSDKPFIAVSCTEFAPGILESELFGHEKGSFTGAISRRPGIFELADQGTLFLDEISEASPALQSKLLRVLEFKRFTRVGGAAQIESDFRILVATNRELQREVDAGRFRQDLFYRLNVFSIEVPPLRDRKGDIPLLAEFHLDKLGRSYQRPTTLSTDAMLALMSYDWPGNVRELLNVLERAVITCHTGVITTRNLPFHSQAIPTISDINLKDIERFFIRLALRRTRDNKTKAAELLGISRKTLIEKVKSYGLGETIDGYA